MKKFARRWGTRMKPENRLEIARRRLAEAEAAVARQANHIEELRKAGHATQSAISVLALLQAAVKAAREALALMEIEEPWQGGDLN